MLIFTFFVTIKSEGIEKNDTSEETVWEYFNLLNEKDISNINQLIANQDEINVLNSKLNYIDTISLKSIEKETNDSLLKAYTKHSKKDINNIRIYKVTYNISYKKDKNSSVINDLNESWIYLYRNDSTSKWLIDVFDI